MRKNGLPAKKLRLPAKKNLGLLQQLYGKAPPPDSTATPRGHQKPLDPINNPEDFLAMENLALKYGKAIPLKDGRIINPRMLKLES